MDKLEQAQRLHKLLNFLLMMFPAQRVLGQGIDASRLIG